MREFVDEYLSLILEVVIMTLFVDVMLSVTKMFLMIQCIIEEVMTGRVTVK